jgi:hypothetical protein
MAYSNGVFYVNLDSGNDGARTALTTCIASNPSGTVTRINKVGHGLVTGAVVDLTLFSAWLNDAWKITKVDNDNFDLDGAVWQTTADNNGTVTPRGGSSWTDAWLTFTNGSTTSRVSSGDEVRVAKTPDPVSIGTATWTNVSETITLSSSRTLLIDNCETAWTASNGSTSNTSTTRIEGSASIQVTKASYLTGTLYAYKTISLTDFSAYDSITFFVRAATSNTVDNNWNLCLCSDVSGSVIVDSFPLVFPQSTGLSAGSSGIYLTLSKSGGGNLGSSINSIALYSHTVAPTANALIGFDNISACNLQDLSLTSLISKTNSPTYDQEGWWSIRSISGSIVRLSSGGYHGTTTAGRGYYGTTESITSYIRHSSFRRKPSGSAGYSTVNHILATTGVSFIGGWNTSSNNRDGMTYLDMCLSTGQGLTVTGPNNSISFFGIFGAYSGICINSSAVYDTNINNCNFSQCRSAGGFEDTSYLNQLVKFENCTVIQSGGGVGRSDNVEDNRLVNIKNCKFVSLDNNLSRNAVSLSYGSSLYNSFFANNAGFDVYINTQNSNFPNISNCTFASTSSQNVKIEIGQAFYRNCIFSSSTEFTAISSRYNYRHNSQNHDLSGYDYIFTDGGTINSELTDRTGSVGKMWRLVLTDSTRMSFYPLNLTVGHFAVNSGSLVTVSAWMKKSHATNCNGRLLIRGYQIDGLDNDLTGTLANNTNWQQLSLNFTPTKNGVFTVEALAEYVAGNANVYIDQVTVTQA